MEKIVTIIIMAVLLVGCSSTKKEPEKKIPKKAVLEHSIKQGPAAGPLFEYNLKETIPDVIQLPSMPKQGAYIDSLRTEFFIHKNPENGFWAHEYPMFADFYSKGSVRTVKVLPDRPKLTYKYWAQKRRSPLIILMPGLASPYTSGTATALAELYHLQGYSVVVISNAMNWLFSQAAISAIVPGFPPEDAKDIYFAIQRIIQDLKERDSVKPRKIALGGYSLGAMHTLLVADIDEKQKLVGFDRYIAINPPVDLYYGLQQLDNMFAVWKKWEKEALAAVGEQEKAEKALQMRIDRVAATYFHITQNGMPENAEIPISQDGAKFLIGFSFHMLLREVICNIHKEYDMSVIRTPYRWISRDNMYMEIGHYSYYHFLEKFLLKYYSELWQKNVTIQELNSQASLKTFSKSFAKNEKIRVFHAVDDFLLRPQDLKWLKQTFKERLTLFDRGGHLGYMYNEFVQQFFINALRD